MNNDNSNEYIDNCFQKVFSVFTINRVIILFTAFLSGMLFHFTKYSRNILTTDAYQTGTMGNMGIWGIQIGRWFPELFLKDVGFGINSGYFIAISCFITISIFSILLNEFFNIKSKTFIIIDTLLLVTYPYTLNILVFNVWTFNLALIFCVIAVKLFLSDSKKTKLLGIIPSIFVLSTYQSDIIVIVLLVVFKYFFDYISDKEELWNAIKKTIIIGLLLIISFIVYYGISQIVVRIYNSELVNYGDIPEKNSFIVEIPIKLKKCYLDFYDYYFSDKYINNNFYKLNYINVIIIFSNFIFMWFYTIKSYLSNKSVFQYITKFILLIIYFAAFPIMLNLFDLFIGYSFEFNITMSAGTIILYFITIFLLERSIFENCFSSDLIKKIIVYFCIIIFIIQIYIYAFIGEATYMSLEKNYNRIYNLINRMVNRVEETDGYYVGMPLMITNINLLDYQTNLEIDKVANINRLGVFHRVGQLVLPTILKEDFGIEMNKENIKEDEILSSKEYRRMKKFPNANSTKVINGVMVVKGFGFDNYEYDTIMEKEEDYYDSIIKNDYDINNSYKPYIPSGFSFVEGEWNTGYVIEDNDKNQFVWVPCTNLDNNKGVVKLSKTDFYQEAFIKYDECYDESYEDFLKSALENGGFYVSRYEIGKEDNKPVSKEQREVWENITRDEANSILKSMYNNELKCELLNGYAYDTTLQWILENNDLNRSVVNDSNLVYTGRNKYNNIFDFADNVLEMTLESDMDVAIVRGFSGINIDINNDIEKYKGAFELFSNWNRESRYAVLKDAKNMPSENDRMAFRALLYK